MRRSAAVKLIIGILLAIVFPAAAAQDVDPTVPPPAITFEEWKEVSNEEGIVEYSLQFPSAVETQHPENNVVPVRVLMPAQREGPIPVVVVLHYWGAYDFKMEHALATDLARKGVGSLLMALPYHIGRTPAGSKSGELAIVPDPAQLVQTMYQSILDVRRALDFIGTRPEFDSSRIGVTGTSLGSLVSSLVYGIDSRVSRAAFMLGGADFAHILWNSSKVVAQRDALRRKGFFESQLREALKSVEPLTYLRQRAPSPTFVIGAKYDTVIPPVDTVKLIAALPQAKTLWLDTGHYGGVFVQRRILSTVANFFQQEFEGKSFVPPDRITAPTVRIVVQVNPHTGFQVGAGLDIWKMNAKGDVFSTLVATPRGLNIFLGGRIDKNFAVGAFGTTRGVTGGVFWSTVL